MTEFKVCVIYNSGDFGFFSIFTLEDLCDILKTLQGVRSVMICNLGLMRSEYYTAQIDKK